MTVAHSGPLIAAVEAVIAERAAMPILTSAWVAREALRRIKQANLKDALLTGAELAADRALNNDYAGVVRRRYRIHREGEVVHALAELLSEGEIVELIVSLRAGAAAALRHSQILGEWRERRFDADSAASAVAEL
jgi:hypothetical protein